MYQGDDEITLCSLLQSIKETFNLEISEYPVSRIREELGYVNLYVRYGHSVREANRQPRVDWCKDKIAEDCTFRRHVFTDESMIQLDPNSRTVWVLSTARERRIKATFKHPHKVLIWGGISWKGVTDLVVLHESCRVDAAEYCRILRDGYIQWERCVHLSDYSIRELNKLINQSTSARNNPYLERWPSESPDLNMGELVRGEMKRWLKTHWKPTSVQHLIEGIDHFWHKIMTVEKCRSYIRHIHTQMRRVIQEEGKPVKD
ncbi:hypothetical protein PENTCL1PPCAC_9313 [Pristionchus entomophagus]|uniref:Tc1-like transposase DDE domain-containing protein n=1 Tax=Pristionchus entomophagus TaxID=358040 RepID=A0AAV5SVI5_9BILA|nr:hypothetical protein PENTCL1PPCAC_9313 [Pristionchus entomophagus]